MDEPSHFLSGRLYWEGRDNLRPGDMPPLMKIVSGWVPLVMKTPLPPPAHEGWRNRDEWFLAMVMMEPWKAAAVRRNYFFARLSMLIFPAGCFLLIWWWGRQIFRPAAAVAAAATFCLLPDVLGHGALVKNDLATSFAYLFFWYRAWRYWREPRRRNAAWLGMAVLTGVMAKYSLAVLLPLAPLILLARHWKGPRRAFRELAVHACIGAFVVWAGVWAAWQFRAEPITLGEFQQWKADPGIPVVFTKAVRVASNIPLPGAFWRGGMSLVSSNHSGAPYLLGHTLADGHPLYFAIALAVKEPLALQALFVAALLSIAAAVRRHKIPPGAWCWILPGFLYLALASMSGLQLGVRLVLPALTCFVLMTGKAFEAAASRRATLVLSAAAMVLLTVRTASAYPNYIPYFNLLVGDSRHGLNILSDSNVDWGQGLRALQSWYRSSGVRKFTLAYFGTENVFAYFNDDQMEFARSPWNAEAARGQTRMPLAPGYYAISATLISGQLFAPQYRDYYAAFRTMKPVACAGGSIFIYRIE